jgi:DNA-binding IclR family transcriptional regulator
MGYVRKSEDVYYVSTRLLKLGIEVRHNLSVFPLVRSELPAVAEEVGEHASLMIEEGGYGVYVYIAEGQNTVDTIALPGTQTHLHMTAPGKAILAYMPSEKRDYIIDNHGLPAATDQTTTDRDELLDELETIRQQGYAVDRGENVEGYHGVAVPLLDRAKEVALGSISVYSPGRRSTVSDFEDGSVDVLMRVANIIEINYAHSP